MLDILQQKRENPMTSIQRIQKGTKQDMILAIATVRVAVRTIQ
jgi:hypothetical protein